MAEQSGGSVLDRRRLGMSAGLVGGLMALSFVLGNSLGGSADPGVADAAPSASPAPVAATAASQAPAEVTDGGSAEAAPVAEAAPDEKASKKPPKTAKEIFDAPANPPEGEGALTLQIASFKSDVDAAKLAKRLDRGKHPVFVVSAEIEGKGTWYRVRVGRYAESAEAKEYAAKLKRAGYASFITRIDR